MRPILQEKSRLEEDIERSSALKSCWEDQEALLELCGEAEGDELEEMLDSLKTQCDELEKRLDETEMVTLLGGEEDKQNAIIEIHSGAGGTEAQDWAEMLERMYLRWAARHGFKVEELDYLPGESRPLMPQAGATPPLLPST